MKTCVARLKSASHYSQSRPHITPKLEGESHDDHEKRTWREKAHANDAGQIVIPGMAFKWALDKAASRLSMKTKGQATFTKHFVAGILMIDDFSIGVQKDTVEAEWVFVNSDGKRGSGKRVWRCFPLVREWEAEITLYVVDPVITEDVFEKHLEHAGKFVGIGRFRPENGGSKGRFEVVSTNWS